MRDRHRPGDTVRRHWARLTEPTEGSCSWYALSIDTPSGGVSHRDLTLLLPAVDIDRRSIGPRAQHQRSRNGSRERTDSVSPPAEQGGSQLEPAIISVLCARPSSPSAYFR